MDLQLYSPRQIGEMIQRSTKTVYRYIRKYQIPVIVHKGKGGRKEFYVMEEDVRAFIVNHFNDFDRFARAVNAIVRRLS